MADKLETRSKWFWAWNDEKEEAWLSEMAKQGLHLEGIPFPGNYQFRKGDPADYIYRLDYQSLTTKDKDSYLQLFSDAGWENVGEMGGWMYFRYAVTNGDTPEIFSDRESKIGKYQRVMIYLVIFLPIMILLLTNTSSVDKYGFFSVLLKGLAASLMLLYSFAMIRLFMRINELKKAN